MRNICALDAQSRQAIRRRRLVDLVRPRLSARAATVQIIDGGPTDDARAPDAIVDV